MFYRWSMFENKKRDRISAVPFMAWFFGRRGVLLHLSGLPCQYHRRVDATKLSTSKNHPILPKVYPFYSDL